jgi:hypothetical protein
MTTTILLASALLLLTPAPTLPASTLPAPQQDTSGIPSTSLRNSFVTAAESVVNNADALDLKADPAHFNGPMRQLQAAEANLNSMAEGDREHNIASAMQDLVVQISLCHIQAKTGASIGTCSAQVSDARRSALDALGMRKSSGAWVVGPPS